jgi:crotonobetainyl-CoA:carnitine CoA-transferase CaiB-like acyl-CoA transferase
VFWRLAESADVIVENFSPGTADRLGIGYREVKARKPDVVYCSVSSYGQFGPWKNGRGWERQGQAVAGIMERQDPPAVLGPYNLIDIGTGTLATFATALGLYHRARTGQGQHVQASLCQTATYQQTPFVLDYRGHVSNEPRGYMTLGTGPMNRFYKAADRWFFLAHADVSTLRDVEGLVLDGEDPSALEQSLEAQFAECSAQVWVERLRARDIAAHERVPVAELMTDAYVRERGLSVCQVVDGVGETTAPGVPVTLSRTPMRIGDPPHRPGADAPQILDEIGMADDLRKLEQAWVLQVNDLPPAWRAE